MALLGAECRRDWGAVKTHLDHARSVDPAHGAPQAALIALALDHAYQGFETILVRIERATGLPERTGSSWHSALLADAGMANPTVRPELFPPEALGDWDALLRFRYSLRHAYAVDLDAGKLATNVQRLERVVAQTDRWLDAVLAGLAAP
jgi:hypothetical protein